jgi:uncharacterized protein YgiM (DUF1202 family)
MADIDRDGNKNFTVGIMKTICWTILGAMVAMGVVAQNNTNALPPIPAPVTSPVAEVAPMPVETNAPAVKHVRHKKHFAAASKKTPLVEPTVTLIPGPAEVAVKNLNVRGQAGLKGEFITHVAKGDVVTVLSQLTLDKHKAGEPAQWAKIALPANVKVWVRAQFIDATNKTVLSKKLNLRAGPSENYSVLGVLERGAIISEVITKGDWTQIETPTNGYAFVAAMYLKQEASGTMATNVAPSAETEPMPTNTPVAEPQPIVTEATNTPPAMEATNLPPATEINTPPPAMIDTNLPAPEIETNLPPPPPRIVTHEGFVRHVHSIIEPTYYELYDPKSGTDIDYLYTTSTNLDISQYNGRHIVVTGEESLAARWKNAPVLTIQHIQVVE